MKNGLLTLAISLIVLGCFIIVQPRFKRIYGGYLDLTGFNVPYGILLIVVGLVSLWISLRKRRPTSLICPKCLTVRTWAEMETSKCNNCGVELEDLRGFYDRHPELKDKI